MAVHGGDIYTAVEVLKNKDIIDFSANINPFGVPDLVCKAINENIDSLVNYPDPYNRKLRKALSEFHNIPIENIVCGNGGADIIFRTAKALKPHHALIPIPSFSEYEEALKETECKITYFNMQYPFRSYENISEEIQKNCYDFLVLCNPNNPTGTLISPVTLHKILDISYAKGIFVLLDECFCDMTEENQTLIKEYNIYPNVLILKSLTKMYAIAGLRVGYGISYDKKLIEKIRCTGQAWSVNTLAEIAGCTALKDTEYKKRFLEFLYKEKIYLYKGLKELGFDVWYPNANYIFFYSGSITDLDKQLLKYRILLRNCNTYRGLETGYYRTAVRTHKENEYLLSCLNEIVNRKEYL